MKKAFLNIFLIINFIVIVALFTAYSSVYISPDKYWIPSLLGMAYPFILIGNLFFIGFWLLFKPRYLLLSLISIIIGWGFVSRYVQLNGKSTENSGIKIISYNVRNFFGGENLTKKECTEEIFSFLEKQNTDIICLQEANLSKNIFSYMPNSAKEYNSTHQYQKLWPSSGLVIITRYPIINMGKIMADELRNMTTFADVIIEKDTVRIFNVHLQSYQIEPKEYSIIDSLGINREKDMKEVKEMSFKFKKAFQIRAGQVRKIRKQIDESPYDVIVCGDFNDTPVSFAYQTLRKNLNDAFVVSGKGVGRTYNGKLPSFRIDNIFYTDNFESYNFRTYDFRLSDHLPISCQLVKK